MGKDFRIENDGTIVHMSTEEKQIDEILLNTIEAGSKDASVYAAYKARKKCYKLIKLYSPRSDYKEYVQQLQLKHYPNEFIKSFMGESIHKWCISAWIFSILLFCLLIWYRVPYDYHIYYLYLDLLVLFAILLFFNVWVIRNIGNLSKQLKKIK